MESVYIETSIISYLVSRPSRDLLVAAHQQITEAWWIERRTKFECYISQAVINEASAGNPDQAGKRMGLLNELPVLKATSQVEELTLAILAAGIVPARFLGDAAHIAVATVHRMDYLMTWNCRHLANAEIMRRIGRLCNKKGYDMSLICTPEELMGE